MSDAARHEARAYGMKLYIRGEPCANGHTSARYVLSNQCVACVKAADARRYDPVKNREAHAKFNAANPDYAQEWRRANPDKMSGYYRKWRLANADRVKESSAAWRAVNKPLIALLRRNRVARMNAAEGTHTLDDIQSIYRLQKGKCGYCRVSIKKSYHVDHIEPISRGGNNFRRNIQLLCPTCNVRKHDHHPADFARKLGMLL